MKKLLNFLPPFVWAAFIFYLSTLQGMGLAPFPYADKIIHALIYAVFGYFIARALFLSFGVSGRRLLIVTAVIAGFYGITDEIHQLYVPTRSFELFDILADFLGGLAGAFAYGSVPRIIKKD